MSETKDTYNRIAEDWHKDHQQDVWWVQGTTHFISLLPTGAEVLDAGCGAGTKTKFLIEHGLNVIGIDFSESLLAIAKREVPGARFELMDMRDMSSLHKEFEGVFAQASLLHIPKRETPDVVAELASKLRSGGHVYIAVKGAREGQSDEEMKEEDDYGYTYRRFFSYYSMDELKSYLNALKLDIVYESTTTVGRTDWLQIIGKKG